MQVVLDGCLAFVDRSLLAKKAGDPFWIDEQQLRMVSIAFCYQLACSFLMLNHYVWADNQYFWNLLGTGS